MSAHVLLNLLNELRKRDKMRGLPSLIKSIIQLHAHTRTHTHTAALHIKSNEQEL